MEKLKTNRIESAKKLNDLNDLLYCFTDKFGKYYRMTELEKSTLMNMRKMVDEREKELDEMDKKIIDFIKDKMHKHWIIERHKKNGDEDVLIDQYVIYPYQFVNENETLFSIMSANLADVHPYNMGLMDKSLPLSWFYEYDYEIKMKEISEEEFKSRVQKSVDYLYAWRFERAQNYKEKKDAE